MGREQERIKRTLETNAVEECNKIQHRFCPELFRRFSQTTDPRHPGYTQYRYLPHGVTVNEYLEKLEPAQMQEIQQSLVYDMIRRKTFDGAKFRKRWLVIVDGTQLYSGSRKINEKCLGRCYNRGTDEEKMNYHYDVLEAKIYFGEKLLASIESEFIENNGEDAERRQLTGEDISQNDTQGVSTT